MQTNPTIAGFAPADRAAGIERAGILHLPVALELYPDARIAAVYNRMSSDGQAGKGKEKLDGMTGMLAAEVVRIAPGKLVGGKIVQAIEEGKLLKPRPKLSQTAAWAIRYAARRRGAVIVVTSDTSRFIRAEAYHRTENPEAWPSVEEFARLRSLFPPPSRTGGVILATVGRPTMTEKERHAWIMRRLGRAGKCGRPRDDAYARRGHDLYLQILYALGPRDLETGRWDLSLSVVAERVAKWTGKSKDAARSMIQRFLDRPVQKDVDERPPPGMEGLTWKELDRPAEIYRRALERGLLK